jgi:hypothetical protein
MPCLTSTWREHHRHPATAWDASIGFVQSAVISIHRHIAATDGEYAKHGGRVENIIWKKDRDRTQSLGYCCNDSTAIRSMSGESLCGIADRKPRGQRAVDRR